MRTVLLLVPALAVVVACQPRARPRQTSGPPMPQVREDAASLTRDLRASILESYETLRGGYDESYLDGLTHDRRLLLIDVAPDAVVSGFRPEASSLRRRFPGDVHEVVSKSLEAHLSDDWSVAWTYDELSYRVVRDGKRAFVPLRATSVYERLDGRWLLIQAHVSYGVDLEETLAAAAAGQLPSPAPLDDDVPDTPVAREVRDVLLALLRDEDERARASHVCGAPECLVLGIDPSSERRGTSIADAPTVRALFGYEFTVRAQALRVQPSPAGTAAWAAANLLVEGVADGRALSLPVRATWVLDRRGGAWQVVQTHVSVPVTARTLAERVFGEAAAAAAASEAGRAPPPATEALR